MCNLKRKVFLPYKFQIFFRLILSIKPVIFKFLKILLVHKVLISRHPNNI